MDPESRSSFDRRYSLTKEECARVDRLWANHLIAQAAQSVRTKVVSMPKTTDSPAAAESTSNAAPTKTVPICSVGPVPPAIAADSPGAADFPAPENGDQILLYLSPLTTVTPLEYQGLTTILQRSPDP